MDAQTSKSGMVKMLVVVVVAALVLGGFALFMAQNVNQQTTQTQSDAHEIPDMGQTGTSLDGHSLNEQMNEETLTTDGEMRTIQMEAGSFYYKPNAIRVKLGDTVRIEMKSVNMMHDFNIDELGVKIPVTRSGDTGTVEFTADQVGEFEFYCAVGQHRQNGQVGTLIVEA